jgi:hypothetical protein
MMFARMGLLFTITLFVFAGWAVFSALGWRQEVAMFPLFVGVTAFVLTGTDLIREGISLLRPGPSKSRSRDVAEGESDADSRAWLAPLWFFGCMVAVLLLGIPIGLPLSLLFLLRYGFGESWMLCISTVAVMEIIALFVFGMLFGVIWPRPMIMEMLF